MALYEFNGVAPQVSPLAFVHPQASVIGNVSIGPDCYIGPFASLRGDFGKIVIAQGSNVQESCTLHVRPDGICKLGVNSHVGHGAVVHGATLERNGLIGMNAVVMDDAFIGANAIEAACAFVRKGSVVDEAMLVGGVPAKVMRKLTQLELEAKLIDTKRYQDLARDALRTLRLLAT